MHPRVMDVFSISIFSGEAIKSFIATSPRSDVDSVWFMWQCYQGCRADTLVETLKFRRWTTVSAHG
jgi:hypothetical protein